MEPNLLQSAFSRGVHPIANERADLQNRNARDCKVPKAVLYLRVESDNRICPDALPALDSADISILSKSKHGRDDLHCLARILSH